MELQMKNSVIVKDTRSCVFQEISGLSYECPESTMRSFCKNNLGAVKFHSVLGGERALYSIYVFSAGFGPSSRKNNYGLRFAQFIRKNKLGKVIGTQGVENKAFHPGRLGAAWLWVPNQDAVKTWWDHNKGLQGQPSKP